MTRQTTKQFLYSFGLNSKEAVINYKNWWSLSEIKAGKQFIEDWYREEVKSFKKSIIIKK